MPIDITTKVSPVIEKAKELCQLIVDQPHFEKLLADIEIFMGDSEAQALHDALSSKQQVLVNKQNSGESLTEQEIDDFEGTRDALMANPVANSFVTARQKMFDVQDSISRLITKTFELGRVPMDEEMKSGGCCGGGGGGGCGCH